MANNYEFEKNVFFEMRGLIIKEDSPLTDESICKAITLNENIKTMGFQLNAIDIVKLAKSSALDTMYDKIKEFNPEISVAPMYPDFPQRIMEIDEATYRFHQIVHYFSTYGMENIFGVDVQKGWLPAEETTPKTKEDNALLNAKVLKVYTREEALTYIVDNIIGKNERFTLPEKWLSRYAIIDAGCKVTKIPFKENISALIFDSINNGSDEGYAMLCSLCQHTGDIFKVLKDYLKSTKFKNLPTSKKRMFVKAFEQYPVADFEENIYVSNQKFAREYVQLLERISYNRFSKSEEHKTIVAQARNKELRSWFAKTEELLKNSKPNKEVLAHIGKRPGIYFRMVNRLYKLGYDKNMLKEELLKHSFSYSIQSIISALTHLSMDNEKRETFALMKEICTPLLTNIYQAKKTPLKDKKVYIDEGDYSFDFSVIEMNDKSEEGGYIRSGLAFRIPENVENIRFFVYWNDKQRVDIDLHSYALDKDNETHHVGWNSSFKEDGMYTSGDITHSDATEYIDVNIEEAKDNDIVSIFLKIHSYTGQNFAGIQTIFTGMMAVSKIGMNKEMKLHDIKNEFFHHELNANATSCNYGQIDIANRVLYLLGKKEEPNTTASITKFSLSDMLDIIISSQNATIVDTKEEADVILTLDKPKEENGISLIDENYFI